MLRVRLLMLLPLCILAISPSFAQHINEPDSPCASVVVTSDLVACLSKARVSSDSALSSLYQTIRKNLDPTETNQLVKTERLWVQYRDANCAAERDLYGQGTGGPPAYLACLDAMTRERTRELRITYTVRLK